MKILVVGTGGVGAAVAAVAQRRDFFERITFADLDPARPQALVDRLADERLAAAPGAPPRRPPRRAPAGAGPAPPAPPRGPGAGRGARDPAGFLNATDPRFVLPI